MELAGAGITPFNAIEVVAVPRRSPLGRLAQTVTGLHGEQRPSQRTPAEQYRGVQSRKRPLSPEKGLTVVSSVPPSAAWQSWPTYVDGRPMALRPTVSRGLPLSVQDTRLLTSTGRRTETPISLPLPCDGGSREVRRRPRRSAIPDKVNGAPPRRNPSRQPNLSVPPCSSPLRQRDGGAVVHRTAAKAPQGDRVESGQLIPVSTSRRRSLPSTAHRARQGPVAPDAPRYRGRRQAPREAPSPPPAAAPAGSGPVR
jgi:hypothetical protein